MTLKVCSVMLTIQGLVRATVRPKMLRMRGVSPSGVSTTSAWLSHAHAKAWLSFVKDIVKDMVKDIRKTRERHESRGVKGNSNITTDSFLNIHRLSCLSCVLRMSFTMSFTMSFSFQGGAACVVDGDSPCEELARHRQESEKWSRNRRAFCTFHV